LIPEGNKELLIQCQVEVKEQDWQYTLSENSTSLGQSSEARLKNIRTVCAGQDTSARLPARQVTLL